MTKFETLSRGSSDRKARLTSSFVGKPPSPCELNFASSDRKKSITGHTDLFLPSLIHNNYTDCGSSSNHQLAQTESLSAPHRRGLSDEKKSMNSFSSFVPTLAQTRRSVQVWTSCTQHAPQDRCASEKSHWKKSATIVSTR